MIHRCQARTRVALLLGMIFVLAPHNAPAPATSAHPAAPPARNADRLVASGQTSGYQGDFGFPADGNRDDGDLIHGRLPEFSDTSVITPATQAENVVTDTNTGLMWLRNVGLLGATDSRGSRGNVRLDRALTWQEAIDAANDLRYAGYDDWRLPNLNELQTLVDFGRSAPALDTAAFPEPFDGLPSPYFWSATTNDRTPFEAFYVNFYDGHAYPWHKAIPFAARPVRDAAVEDPVAVFQTGQKTGYEGNLGLDKPGNRDDGDLRRGLRPDYAWRDDGRIDTPEENVVTGRHTDLMWLRDPLRLDGSGGAGGNRDLRGPVDWQTAVAHCNGLDFAGYADWRLPNIRELISITQSGRPGTSG